MTRIWPLPCEGLGNHSYLAEVGSGLALAVDPGRDPRSYLGLAAAHGLRVAFTADTHVHADFVSGSRELAADGARLLAPAGSGLSFPHQELRDGEQVDLGGLALRALATPGHTPEHLSYLLLDGGRPVAVFTGGALIVGGWPAPTWPTPPARRSGPGRRTARRAPCLACRPAWRLTRRTDQGQPRRGTGRRRGCVAGGRAAHGEHPAAGRRDRSHP